MLDKRKELMDIVKRIIVFTLFFVIVYLTMFPINSLTYARAELQPLQPMIDQVTPGGRLVLESGNYQGSITIDKSIKIEGKGKVVLYGSSDFPVIHVRANQVEITGIQIVDKIKSPQDAVMVIEGNHHLLSNIDIRTRGSGIQLREAHNNELTNIYIEGLISEEEKGNTSFSKRGNGIDLWGSHDNRITSCTISNMMDGIYMESSESNVMLNNRVSDSRYGYHIMFTKDIIIADNQGKRNVTGAMVMSAEQTQVIRNRFFKQSENVNSQGLLLFDAISTLVSDNHVEGNRVGIYMHQSTGNQILNNSIVHNFIGMQMVKSENNDIEHNQFISNIVQAQDQDSQNNRIKENYFDDAQKIDLQGDHKSELPYRVNPFFLNLTNLMPPFQLFFQSPGMMFLESLFQVDSDQWMSDLSPLMYPEVDATGNEPARQSITLFLMYSILFITSIYSISWGAFKK